MEPESLTCVYYVSDRIILSDIVVLLRFQYRDGNTTWIIRMIDPRGPYAMMT